MKKVSICKVLFFISCLFQLSPIYAQESQIVEKGPITIEFKLVCDGNSESCEKVLVVKTREELYVQKASILSLEDVNFAEIESTETPQAIIDVMNGAGFRGEPRSSSLILKLNEKGKEKLGQITSQNIGKRIAIFIDGDLVLAPLIMEPISGGVLAVSCSSLDKAKSITERINQVKELDKRN